MLRIIKLENPEMVKSIFSCEDQKDEDKVIQIKESEDLENDLSIEAKIEREVKRAFYINSKEIDEKLSNS